MSITANRTGGRVVRSAPVLLTFILALGPAFSFQDQKQVPSFHVASRLVELTVVASDREGKPVGSLEAGDFEVFDNGKPQKLSLCRYEGRIGRNSASGAPSPEFPPLVFSNRIQSASDEDRNVTVLVLDTANTDSHDQMIVKAQTARFLKALAPHTRVAIYQLGQKFQVLHDFTDDMDQLRADIAKLSLQVQAQQVSDVEEAELELQELLAQMAARNNPNIAAMQAAIDASTAAFAGEVNANAEIKGNRVEATLAALEILGRHLAPVPGRKSVVWISGGISLFAQQATTNPNMRLNPMVGNNMEAVIRKTSERLAELGVVLYAVDAHGLTTTEKNFAKRQYPPMIGGRFSEVERAAAQNLEGRAAFSMMTSVTGGRYIYGTNDLAKGVDEVTADLDGSYTLGFYATEEPDGKWHSLKVKVKEPGVRLLHKQGYLADPVPAGPPAWDNGGQRLALTSPFGSDAIRLTAYCAPAAGAEPGTLQLTLQIEAEDLLWRQESGRMSAALDVYIAERAAGKPVHFQQSKIQARLRPEQMEIARQKGLPYRHQWKPDPGTRTIRVLVRDEATEQFGTVDIPLSEVNGQKK